MAAPTLNPSASNKAVYEEGTKKGQNDSKSYDSASGCIPSNAKNDFDGSFGVDDKNKTNISLENSKPAVLSEPTYTDSENSKWYTTGKSFLDFGAFEEALAIIEEGINSTKGMILSYRKKNEEEDDMIMLHESMAPLHYLYGTTLLYSIEESDENQAMTVGGLPAQSTSDVEIDQCDANVNDNAVNDPVEEEEYENENRYNESGNSEDRTELNEDITEDMQIAWENLDLARTIIERMIEKFDKNMCDEKPSILLSKLQKDLAQVYLREGDLQRMNSKYETAINDYDQTLKLLLLQPNDNTFATSSKLQRKIADVHYNLGLTHFMFVAASKSTTATAENDEETAAAKVATGDVARLTETKPDASTNDTEIPVIDEKSITLARNRGFYHYLSCAMTFGKILATEFGVPNVEDFLNKADTQFANMKRDDTEEHDGTIGSNHYNTNWYEDGKIASLKVNALRIKLVKDLHPTTSEMQDSLNDIMAVLDEIQETIDEAESSELGVQEVTAMKESITAAVAQQTEDENAFGSEFSSTTNTCAFGMVDESSSTAAAAAAAAVEPTTNIITQVRKKAKKREVVAIDEEPSKRYKIE